MTIMSHVRITLLSHHLPLLSYKGGEFDGMTADRRGWESLCFSSVLIVIRIISKVVMGCDLSLLVCSTNTACALQSVVECDLKLLGSFCYASS